MKRKAFLRHMTAHGCTLVREGGRHSWWQASSGTRRSAVPRHAEISDILIKKICRDLGIPSP